MDCRGRRAGRRGARARRGGRQALLQARAEISLQRLWLCWLETSGNLPGSENCTIEIKILLEPNPLKSGIGRASLDSTPNSPQATPDAGAPAAASRSEALHPWRAGPAQALRVLFHMITIG